MFWLLMIMVLVVGVFRLVMICSSVDLFELFGLSSVVSDLLGILSDIFLSVVKLLKCFVMDWVVIIVKIFGV